MSKVQNFTPKGRHLATEKNTQNPNIWAVTLRKESKQTLAMAHSSVLSSKAFGSASTEPWGWSIYQQQKEQQPRESWIKTKSRCMSPSLSQAGIIDGVFKFSPPFAAQTGVSFGFLCMQWAASASCFCIMQCILPCSAICCGSSRGAGDRWLDFSC